MHILIFINAKHIDELNLIRMKYILLNISLLLISLNFYGQHTQNPDSALFYINKVVVEQAIQVSEYTYLRVKEDSLVVSEGDTLWLGVPKMEVEAGDTVYYSGGFFVYDLKSRDLNRTFKRVLFLSGISKTDPSLQKTSVMPESHSAWIKSDSTETTRPSTSKIELKIDPVEGAVTIGELYSKKTTYDSVIVKVKGKVTKFSSGIMNTNWIHLQDGTESDGKFDLTITSDEEVKVGEIVVLEGKIVLNKDFGYGYNYDVLMENAKIIK